MHNGYASLVHVCLRSFKLAMHKWSMKMHKWFRQGLGFCVRDGDQVQDRIHFWADDLLCSPLSSSFPSLLRIVINKTSRVKECYVGYGRFVSWVVPFRHSLCQYEESEFGSLLSILSNIFLYRGEADRHIWKLCPLWSLLFKILLEGVGVFGKSQIAYLSCLVGFGSP